MNHKITFTPTLNFYVLKKGEHKGKQQVKIRITINRKSTYQELDIFLYPNEWDDFQGIVLSHNPHFEIYNQSIADSIDALESRYGLKKVKKIYSKKVEGVRDTEFFAWSYLFIKRHYTNLETQSNKEKSINKFREFVGREIYFNSIDEDLIKDFKKWCFEKGNIENTVNNNLRCIRSIYNLAKSKKEQAFDMIENPWQELKTPTKKPKYRHKLQEEEVKALIEIYLPENRQNDARNFFIFSYYHFGMRASDVLTARFSQVKNGRFSYSMRKNKKPFSIALQPDCQKIVDYYWNIELKDKRKKRKQSDYIFPFLENKNMTAKELKDSIGRSISIINKNLGKIEKLIGTQKHITCHVARHTFASITMRKTKGNRFALMQTMGHSSSVTTDNYIEGFSSDEHDVISEIVYQL